MVSAVKTCFGKYFTFSGRARRPEYWWFVLFIFLGSIVFAVFDGILFGAPEGEDSTGPLQGLFNIVTFIPMLAVGWRRLHDTGRSGWFLLLPYAAGALLALIMLSGVVVVSALDTVATAGGEPAGAGAVAGGLIVAALGGVVMLVTLVLLLYWLVKPTEPQDNRFGPVPPL